MTFVPTDADPFDLFQSWMSEAEEKEVNDPNAMALATVGESGMPSVRMVLLKGYDERGFVFYTNLGSQKARELIANPKASLLFHWKSLRRQIRISGEVEAVSDAEADAYYASRPRDSRIGAWASKQSQPLDGMFELEARVAKFAAKFALGEIPRPEFWSGFRIKASRLEFWHDRPFRLHERVIYIHGLKGWEKERLYP
ncbi:pyridoxamine 5'-phosphate oxidase [Magnetovibrio blakemorei]|uniref:Pyridoxine/pyridoxamine 5'-phosphate oxidase n=1 Tax=Magnetovibrio blakemorei TaxID=28181 RepID=A0A1E5Q9Q1_9PROT|nr:pyridoxamine 5'-phosphate oxidase [Magnetovibrio blakemorei]OEJ68408.1 pyridoxamine 5'-phosphate oxidase [Magnetovibrio blakemorei]